MHRILFQKQKFKLIFVYGQTQDFPKRLNLTDLITLGCEKAEDVDGFPSESSENFVAKSWFTVDVFGEIFWAAGIFLLGIECIDIAENKQIRHTGSARE